MSLFKETESETAFLKMGLMGFAGAGKSLTAAKVAIGLVQMCRKRKLPYADKPVYFLDTEGGVDYLREEFRSAGIKLMTARTRAFKDLTAAIAEAEKNGSVLIVDSITHFWEEWCETYKVQKNRQRGLEFADWSFLKGGWRKGFTDKYLNSKLHIILCGRAGYEYEHYVDDAGKKQIEKSGIKMKAEGEMGYEPSLLVLMERDMDMDDKSVHRAANVLKDRFQDLDGKKLPNPTFASFMPHIVKLNLGGTHAAIDASRTSADMIPDDPKREDNSLRRQICVDEIQALLVKHYPSTSGADKQAKAHLIEKYFKTTSWTEIERLMPLFDLQKNFDALHVELEKRPSRYDKTPAPAIDDEIPDFPGDAKPQPSIAETGKVKDGAVAPAPAVTTPASASQPAATPEAADDDDDSGLLEAFKDTLANAGNAKLANAIWVKFEINMLPQVSAATAAKAKAIHAEALARFKAPVKQQAAE